MTVHNPDGVILKHICIMVLMLGAAVAHADWNVRQAAAASTGCVLETTDIIMHDGYQDTWVRLNINAERLLVMTDSNIDTGFDDLALQVDGKALVQAGAAVDEKNLRFDSDMAAIIERFRKGNKVRVYLRFWPSYPATQRYAAVFSLTGFTRTWNEFMECRDPAT
jgi:hypothetical protein